MITIDGSTKKVRCIFRDLNAVWVRVQQDPVDEVALRELVDQWVPGFLGYCRAVLHDAHTAEDVVSASFAALLRHRGELLTAEGALHYCV